MSKDEDKGDEILRHIKQALDRLQAHGFRRGSRTATKGAGPLGQEKVTPPAKLVPKK
jgi:hypothetical protein